MKILIRFDDIAENMNWHLMAKCEKIFDDKISVEPWRLSCTETAFDINYIV